MALAPDGERFAVLMATDEEGEQEVLTVTFLHNFFDELELLAPVER
jgi:hypothetical protein